MENGRMTGSSQQSVREQQNGMVHAVCIMAVICLFVISALMLLNVGVRVYRNIALNNLETFELRTSLSFVTTRIHQSDETGRLYLSEKDGTTVLTLEEEIEGVIYETLLYHRDGVLYELYQEKGNAYELTDGMEVMDIASFSFFQSEPGLFQLTAANEKGETQSRYVAVRSAAGSK